MRRQLHTRQELMVQDLHPLRHYLFHTVQHLLLLQIHTLVPVTPLPVGQMALLQDKPQEFHTHLVEQYLAM
jgi:hypothetical protein